LIAWIAAPWAAAAYSGWLALPVLVVLVGLPSIFSTEGDKNNVVVATPGPIRVLIELGLFAIAASAPLLVWPTVVAAACSAVVAIAVVFGLPRLRWLLRGAPQVGQK
jgi:hypothetical protein